MKKATIVEDDKAAQPPQIIDTHTCELRYRPSPLADLDMNEEHRAKGRIRREGDYDTWTRTSS